MICVTRVGRAEGSTAVAAALACAGADPDRPALLIALGDGRAPRPTLVASAAARRLEERLVAQFPEAGIASRGRLCQLTLPADEAGVARLGPVAAVGRDLPGVLHAPPHLLQPLLDEPGVAITGVILRADLGEDRALTAIAARDLIGRGLRVGILKRPLGWVAARRALLGALPAGGSGALPARLVERLGEKALSHSCYIDRDDPRINTARAAERQWGDHAIAGPR